MKEEPAGDSGPTTAAPLTALYNVWSAVWTAALRSMVRGCEAIRDLQPPDELGHRTQLQVIDLLENSSVKMNCGHHWAPVWTVSVRGRFQLLCDV